MARLMLSLGMFSALAAAMAVRRRGLPSGSPPPALAATMISLIRRVKILPRLASRAPFLCLMVAHFEWPYMLVKPLLCFGFWKPEPGVKMAAEKRPARRFVEQIVARKPVTRPPARPRPPGMTAV